MSEKSDGILSLYNDNKKEFIFYKYECEKFNNLINDLNY